MAPAEKKGNPFRYPHAPIGNIGALARHLGYTEHDLAAFAIKAQRWGYRVLHSRTEKSDDPRIPDKVTYSPEPWLKELHRRINSKLFKRVSFPPYVVGGVPGRSLLDAVSKHQNARCQLSFDVRRFFESTTSDQVARMYLHLFNFSPSVTELLLALTTINGHLPRGAPTSTYLANLLFFTDEPAFVYWLESHPSGPFRYSRWIDDLTITAKNTISKQTASEVVKRTAGLLRRRGLKVHPSKKHVLLRAKYVIVHNIRIQGNSMSIEGKRRKKVKIAVHQLGSIAALRPFNDDELYLFEQLQSTIGYMQPFHPSEVGGYRAKLEHAWKQQALHS